MKSKTLGMVGAQRPGRSANRGSRAARAPTAAPTHAEDPVRWVFSLAKSERGHKRREAILKAATAEFMQKGYQRASLRSIIQASGGSAETLYRQFGNKAGLFAAVVGAPRERHLQFVGEPTGRPIEVELLDIARAFLESAVRPESLAIVRMMIGESGTMPEVSRMIWEFGPASFHAQLAEYFSRQVKLGILDIADPLLAARQFIGVTRANLDVRLMCGITKPNPEELERQARSGVEIFLRGVRVRPKPSRSSRT
jgi:AcrR family transcriptional regulator